MESILLDTPIEGTQIANIQEASESKQTKEINISPEARAKLLEWKLTEEQINTLVRLNTSLEIGQCEEKVARMTKEKPIAISSAFFSNVCIPNYHDLAERDDGTDADLAKRFLLDASVRGLLSEIMKNNPYIVFRLAKGKSEEFFQKSRHAWLEITGVGSDNIPGADERIIIDPTFKTIKTEKQSSNIASHRYQPNPDFVPNYNPEIFIPTPESDILSNPDITVSESRFKQLGFSKDSKFLFSIGFLQGLGEAIPTIKLTDINGKLAGIVKLKDDLLSFILPKSDQLLPENLEEITNILKTFEQVGPIKGVDLITEEKILNRKEQHKLKYA